MPFFKISKLVGGSLFKKPATNMYPVKSWVPYERTRGHIEIDIDACIFCGICAKKCPTVAIEVEAETGTWAIDPMRCIQCNCCVEVCPKDCLFDDPHYPAPSANKVIDKHVGTPPVKKPKAKPKVSAEAPAASAAPAAATTAVAEAPAVPDASAPAAEA